MPNKTTSTPSKKTKQAVKSPIKKRNFPKSLFLLFVGVGIIIHEAFRPQAQLYVLTTGLILCGFPVAETADIFRNAVSSRNQDDEDESSENEGGA